jgi:O-antigen ligase
MTARLNRPGFAWPWLVGLVAAFGLGLTLAAAPFGMVLAVGLFVVAAGASAWRPAIGLAGVIVTIPVQTSATFAIGAKHLTFTKLALVALVTGWFAHLLITRALPPVTGITLGFVAYVVALAASIWNADSLGAWAGETYRWLTAAGIYVIASQALKRRGDVVAALAATGASVLVCFGVAVIQVLRHSGPSSFTVDGVTRAFGAFGEPNPFAAYFEFTALPLVAIAAALVMTGAWRREVWLTLLAAAAAVCGLLGVYLTHSRGGAIGAACGLAAIGVIVDRRTRVAALAVAGALALAIVATGRTSNLVDRVEALGVGAAGPVQVTSTNFSVEERLAHWGAAYTMWEQHPIIGVGAGNFNEHFRIDTPVWRFRIPRGHAHDGYLQAAAQAGAVGLVAYLGLLAAVLVRGLRVVARAKEPLARGIGVGAVGVTMAAMTHGIFDYVHVLNLGLQLSVAWGALEFAATRLEAAPERMAA